MLDLDKLGAVQSEFASPNGEGLTQQLDCSQTCKTDASLEHWLHNILIKKFPSCACQNC